MPSLIINNKALNNKNTKQRQAPRSPANVSGQTEATITKSNAGLKDGHHGLLAYPSWHTMENAP
jgi:hypothetical protein